MQWLEDSCKYNEWMNEMDYVVKESDEVSLDVEVTPDFSPAVSYQDLTSVGLSNEQPQVTIVNLDRRLPIKWKRSEYEPIPESKLLNISPASFLQSTRKPDETRSAHTNFDSSTEISEQEELCFGFYFSKKGFIKDQYIEIRNSVLKAYHDDPNVYHSVVDLISAYQSLDAEYLSSIHVYLEFTRKINYVVCYS